MKLDMTYGQRITEEFQRKTLDDLLSQCEEKHRDLFKKLYPKGVKANQLNWAITQCHNTLLNLPAKYDPKNGIPKGSYDAVLAELDKAVREAYKSGIKYAESKLSLHDLAYAEGFASAVEKAAGVVADATPTCEHDSELNSKDLIERIRALSLET